MATVGSPSHDIGSLEGGGARDKLSVLDLYEPESSES